MPGAMLKVCGHPGGCTELTTGARCPEHEQKKEQQRYQQRSESLGECDYNSTRWRKLRELFRTLLVAAGVPVACGARLPGAPETNDSQCRTHGVVYGDAEHRLRTRRSLHVDHIRPHRGLVALFFDVLNLQLLCQSCHAVKSQREGQ